MTTAGYTAGAAFIDALNAAGISHLFVNLGSDHPAIVEAIAAARAEGRTVPTVITCPNEMTGMSAAQGFTQVSRRPQAVLVHVECGTQALAGAVHNAAKCRVPMLIFAGASPLTQEGELKGSRNEFIHWLQDVHDQRGIVRGYVKYDGEIRTGHNLRQIVNRALQISTSDPTGPVYLMAAREVLEAELPQPAEPLDPALWQPVAPLPLSGSAVGTLRDAFAAAEAPLVVTSWLGRNPEAVSELVRFCEATGAGLVESAPAAMNFPHDHELYQGNQWNEPRQNASLAASDCILVIDSDVPWIPTVSRPPEDAAIFHIDVDPLKEQMPLWYIGARLSLRADAATALRQLNAALDAEPVDAAAVRARTDRRASVSGKRRAALAEREHPAGAITTAHLVACLRRHLDDDCIVLNEGITNYTSVCDHLASTRPGSYFASGAGSLGWNGGAAVGAKLAAPEKTVIAITGDGSYLFSVPSSVHWMAARYGTPFLQIVLNNGGWRAPRFSALAVHPDGHASRAADLDISFEPAPDYAGIAAAAGGAAALRIERSDEVEAAVVEGLRIVREEKRAAVIDARVAAA